MQSGNTLPFSDQTFDGVLALWSLNHVSEPELVFREVHRVTKINGRFLIVLEDMEPRWKDLIEGGLLRFGIHLDRRPPLSARSVFTKTNVIKKLCGFITGREWPLQSDHICIRDKDIKRWSDSQFSITRREWLNGYLIYELQRQ